MEVSAGFIVGFDNDDATIFEDQYRFIQDNGILLAMVGMLTAVPKTPLYERLETGRTSYGSTTPIATSCLQQMTPSGTAAGLLATAQTVLRSTSFLRSLFSRSMLIPISNSGAPRLAIRANEGKALPTLVYGLLLLKTLVLALIKERSLTTDRGGIFEKLLSTQS